MENKVLPDFIAKAAGKYGDNFHRLYLDDRINGSFTDLVETVPKDERLKIYVSGHGGVGIDFITDDTQQRKFTVDDLVDLLADGLMSRNTTKATSGLCQVNMISCLFGRTVNGRADSAPAAKVHSGLADWDVFVDLVARTESIVCTRDGRQTISLLNHHVYEPVHGRLPQFYIPKAPYTKVLYTFQGDARVTRFAAYDRNDSYVESSTLEGRRLLWADFVVNELAKVIHLKPSGFLGRGGMKVTDEREQVLERIITSYDVNRRPVLLEAKLKDLVDNDPRKTDSNENFMLHRNLASALTSSEPPKKAQLIKKLLAAYPAA
jgi:hypothetical protein